MKQREIKFRFWNKERNEMIINMNLGVFNRIKEMGYPIMQYTGLKDKNGKEIYEGDVVLCEDRSGNKKKCETVFDNGRFIFNDFFAGIKSVEVIGNIYENPKLITP